MFCRWGSLLFWGCDILDRQCATHPACDFAETILAKMVACPRFISSFPIRVDPQPEISPLTPQNWAFCRTRVGV